MLTKLTRMFYDIHKNKMCWRIAFKHFRQCLNINDYFLIFLIVCLALIAAILYKADEIDAFTLKQAKAIENYAQDNNRLRAETIKGELLVVSMLNGAIIENGRLKTVCVITAAGNCE